MVLVVVMLVLFAIYARVRGARALHRTSPGTQRPPAPARLGRWRWPALAFCSSVVAVTLVLPVGVLVYWATRDLSTGFDAAATAANAANSLLAASCAAAAAAVAAIVVAVLSVRFPGYATRAIERVGYAGYALPGIVVALALVFFGTRVALPLYQTLATDIFRQTTTGFFEAGAIPALILLLIAAPPLYLLNEKGVTST